MDAARSEGWALFDTAIGHCAIAWGQRGLRRLQLPEGNDRATIVRLCGLLPGLVEAEPPEAVRAAIALVQRLLGGERVDLNGVELDLDELPEFKRQVYAATRLIPAGETRSYGDIARRIGEPGAARAVGQALGENPLPIIVPCHRVLAADGSLHGFSARGGLATKQRLLEIERAQAAGSLPLFPDD